MKSLKELPDQVILYICNDWWNKLTLEELEKEKERIEHYISNDLYMYNREYRLEAMEYLIEKRLRNGIGKEFE